MRRNDGVIFFNEEASDGEAYSFYSAGCGFVRGYFFGERLFYVS